MTALRKTLALTAAGAMFAAPLTLMTAAPAQAADREFRCAGAEVDFDVSKDDGKYEVEVDIDDAKPGSKWRITLRQNGKVYHNKVHRADRDGDIEIEKDRRNTRGKDVFKLRVKRVGGPAACTATITRR